MTCIVGLAASDGVWIGGDRAGVDGRMRMTPQAEPKVFRHGRLLIGFTSSFRMGQLIQFATALPDPEDIGSGEAFKWMVRVWVPAARQVLRDGGFSKIENNTETGGSFLVGCAGRLFAVHEDFQVNTSVNNYMALGSGEHVALGAMHAGRSSLGTPSMLIGAALDAATHHIATVCQPFDILHLPNEAAS